MSSFTNSSHIHTVHSQTIDTQTDYKYTYLYIINRTRGFTRAVEVWKLKPNKSTDRLE